MGRGVWLGFGRGVKGLLGSRQLLLGICVRRVIRGSALV
jgi:hypothetical protein